MCFCGAVVNVTWQIPPVLLGKGCLGPGLAVFSFKGNCMQLEVPATEEADAGYR